jgi:hypothetical protein
MNTIVMGIKQMFPSGDDLADWPVIMATSILAMIPPVIVVIGHAESSSSAALWTARNRNSMATVTLNRQKALRQDEVIHGIDDRDRRRRVHRDRRPVGLRQVHAAAHGGGAGDDHRGRGPIGGKRVNESSRWTATSPWCSRTTRSTRI